MDQKSSIKMHAKKLKSNKNMQKFLMLIFRHQNRILVCTKKNIMEPCEKERTSRLQKSYLCYSLPTTLSISKPLIAHQYPLHSCFPFLVLFSLLQYFSLKLSQKKSLLFPPLFFLYSSVLFSYKLPPVLLHSCSLLKDVSIPNHHHGKVVMSIVTHPCSSLP